MNHAPAQTTVTSPALPLSEVEAPIVQAEPPALPSASRHEAAARIVLAISGAKLMERELALARTCGEWRPETVSRTASIEMLIYLLQSELEQLLHLTATRGGQAL
jgi:hypothetical protein